MSATNTAAVPRLALNVKEACAALGVSWDVWREHVETDVRVVRVGSRKLVPVAELERWLSAHAETTLGSQKLDRCHDSKRRGNQ